MSSLELATGEDSDASQGPAKGPGRTPGPAAKLQALAAVLRDYAAVIMFVILFVVLAISSSAFLTSGNLANILGQQAPLLIVSAAVTMAIIAGHFDLSTASMVAVANVCAALIANHTGSATLGLLSAPAVGLGLGVINGLVITLLRVHSFLGTLATSLVYSALALILTDGSLVPVAMPSFSRLGQDSWGPFTISTYLMVAWVLITIGILNGTVLGRHIFAVGGNQEAALLSGVRVNLTHVTVFAFNGLACGVAAAIIVSRVSSGQPTQGSDITLNAIAAVILGGTSINGGSGAIWRSMTGVLLIALIGNGFNILDVNQFYRSMATGVIIVLAVALAATSRRR